MSQLQSQGYPFDQEYISGAFENAVQCFAKAQGLGDIYVLATASCFVLVLDSADGPHAPSGANKGRIYPIALAPVPAIQGGYVFRSWHGRGRDFAKGLWVGAYSTAALAAAGGAPDLGNILWIEANYGRGRIPNAVPADPKGHA